MHHLQLVTVIATILISTGCSPRRPLARLEEPEQIFISNAHQLVTKGKRAGEGYFSSDGSKIIYQAEDASNPFYQIFMMDIQSGKTSLVSTGHGKTTCSWIHPTEDRVLFASTHEDPATATLEKAELDFRASGKERHYQWDFDVNFDIFESSTSGANLKNITKVKGYDAEGSYSPDGQWIAFASNRHGYAGNIPEDQKVLFKKDPSTQMDIYLMRADGSKVRRLTTALGYDGGPFFSSDGKKITWRRFAPNGRSAEVYTMNIDGSDKKKLTNLKSLSWAPYFHPSGDYLIFSTAVHGFRNFELYLVDAAGSKKPVRVTTFEGFDGLPVFSPDGTKLAWTSSRNPAKSPTIFLANWNDKAARKSLGLSQY